ncbi:MAG: acyl carrier protein [Clostridiales bacterium]|nr:acyl carrier protein [Clostridiales bacterium]MDY4894717.1 acyl carrier protein [Christensenellaceae bacterium]HAC10441.1 acyl carrier protein [Clostridiales bacterium]
MFEKVRDMLAEALNIPADKITPESKVTDDLGADSLDMVELLSRLEDEEGIVIPEEDLDSLATVGDIVDELTKLTK